MLPSQRDETQHTAKEKKKKTKQTWGSITTGRKAPGHKAAKIQSRNIGRLDNAAALSTSAVISTANAAPLKNHKRRGGGNTSGD